MLRMPYGNGAFVMTVYLPGENSNVKRMIARMAEDSQTAGQGWSERTTSVWFPKFKLSPQRTNLEEILRGMGMDKAFSQEWLDLVGNREAESFIDKVFQTATITVDESGTEAAAVTVITNRDLAAYPGDEFHADRPFVYTISESSTGAILFAGVYRGM